jgi:hypothetical protein
MKKIAIAIFLTIPFAFLYSQKTGQGTIKNPGAEKIINSSWTFNYFSDENASDGYQTTDFDDSKWQAVSIPHTWMTYETTGDLHPFIDRKSVV